MIVIKHCPQHEEARTGLLPDGRDSDDAGDLRAGLGRDQGQ